MKAKELVGFIRLRWKLKSLMVEIKETMALSEAAEIYAKYVCKMYGWDTGMDGVYYTGHFCAVDCAFMNGYIKAMHDNGYEFQNGLIVKRDITEDMPCGALYYYRKDAILATKAKAVETLVKVMENQAMPRYNINVLINKFEEELNKEDWRMVR